MQLNDELVTFRNYLKKYRELLLRMKKPENGVFVGLPLLEEVLQGKSLKEVAEETREKLIQDVGRLRDDITRLTRKEQYIKFGVTFDIWSTALVAKPSADINYDCIDAGIDLVTEAIGKLQTTGESEHLVTSTVSEEHHATHPSLAKLYDMHRFHPKINEVSRQLFIDGHYADAILKAFIAVECVVKEKSKLDISGKSLMSQAFRVDAPIIKLNDLTDQTDRDEQDGFKFLFMGAMVGIRNPKAHAIIEQKDPYKTLEYLGLASLLVKTIDFWKVDSQTSI